jgi:hypothetical protein
MIKVEKDDKALTSITANSQVIYPYGPKVMMGMGNRYGSLVLIKRLVKQLANPLSHLKNDGKVAGYKSYVGLAS